MTEVILILCKLKETDTEFNIIGVTVWSAIDGAQIRVFVRYAIVPCGK